jgi:multiple sugar transport system permease protein
MKNPNDSSYTVNASYKKQLFFKRLVISIIMIVLSLLALVPLYLMLINATRNTAQINTGLSFLPGGNVHYNWHALTSRHFQIWQGFANSAWIAVWSTVLGVYFSAMTAYGLHVYRFHGRNVLWTVILIAIMVPTMLSFVGFYQMMAKVHMLDSYLPLIIPSIAAAGTVLFIRQYMSAILSKELIEAARIDGAGEFRIFNVIIFPILTPALATQAIFSFIGSWNNFFTPFVLISTMKKYTLPMLVQSLRGDIYRTEMGGIYLGITISLIPVVIVYLLLSRYIISGLTMGSVKE